MKDFELIDNFIYILYSARIDKIDIENNVIQTINIQVTPSQTAITLYYDKINNMLLVGYNGGSIIKIQRSDLTKVLEKKPYSSPIQE